ncbi:MAG: DUF3299 domain-containing protein [bacterium]|nr:DUF3299 domain-containing protein [bacterium]
MSKPYLTAPVSCSSRLSVSGWSGYIPTIPSWSKCCLSAALLGLLALAQTAVAQEKQASQAQAASGQSRFQTTPTTTAEDRSSRGTAISKGDLTFDDIKFEIEKGGKFQRDMLTEEIESLHKKTIRIRGYILPASVFTQSGIEEFVLVRDNMECCFGPGAALYDCIMVQMEKGKTADFTTRPVAVRGKFEIQEFKYPGSEEHYAIYKLTATEVK